MKAARNDSKLNTVIVLAITSTLKFGELPGNVVLKKGEANLPKRCVVNATQIKSVDKSSLKEPIGSLSKRRMAEIQGGLKQETGRSSKRACRENFSLFPPPTL